MVFAQALQYLVGSSTVDQAIIHCLTAVLCRVLFDNGLYAQLVVVFASASLILLLRMFRGLLARNSGAVPPKIVEPLPGEFGHLFLQVTALALSVMPMLELKQPPLSTQNAQPQGLLLLAAAQRQWSLWVCYWNIFFAWITVRRLLQQVPVSRVFKFEAPILVAIGSVALWTSGVVDFARSHFGNKSEFVIVRAAALFRMRKWRTWVFTGICFALIRWLTTPDGRFQALSTDESAILSAAAAGMMCSSLQYVIISLRNPSASVNEMTMEFLGISVFVAGVVLAFVGLISKIARKNTNLWFSTHFKRIVLESWILLGVGTLVGIFFCPRRLLAGVVLSEPIPVGYRDDVVYANIFFDLIAGQIIIVVTWIVVIVSTVSFLVANLALQPGKKEDSNGDLDCLQQIARATEKFYSICARKFTHVVVSAVVLPGVVCTGPFFMTIVLIFGLLLYLLLEGSRASDCIILGGWIKQNLYGFLDERDKKGLVVTPFYLLTGIAFPILAETYSAFLVSLPLGYTNRMSDWPSFDLVAGLMGVFSVGIADAAAAVSGSYIHLLNKKRNLREKEKDRVNLQDSGVAKQDLQSAYGLGRLKLKYLVKLPGSRNSKSLIGLLAFFLTLFVSILGSRWLEHRHSIYSGSARYSIRLEISRAFCVALTGAIFEGYTNRIDNMFVPIFVYVTYKLSSQLI